jgi:YidC/Oxa1 family membrane protein insertase
MWTNFVTWIGSVLEQITQTNGGSLGLAIITLALVVRIGLIPLSIYVGRRSIVQQRNMARLKPKLEKLKEKFKKNPQKLQKETLALYQKEGVSPLDGKSILVSLLRAPIFIAVAQTFRSPSKERVVSY